MLKVLGDEARDSHCSGHKKTRAWGSLHICLLRANSPFLGMLSVMVTGTKRFGWHRLINARVQERLLPVCFPGYPSNSLRGSSAGTAPWIWWSSELLLSHHTDTLSHSRPLCFSSLTEGTIAVMTFHVVRLQGTLELPDSPSRAITLRPPEINEPYLGTHELHKLKNWNPIFNLASTGNRQIKVRHTPVCISLILEVQYDPSNRELASNIMDF